MTCARKHFAPRGLPGRYHCIARCVRRAFLCGNDPYSGKNFDHRRQWVETRITLLADLFAVSVMSYAVMSNHLHVVLELRPDAAETWTAEDVADRWIRLFPSPARVATSSGARFCCPIPKRWPSDECA